MPAKLVLVVLMVGRSCGAKKLMFSFDVDSWNKPTYVLRLEVTLVRPQSTSLNHSEVLLLMEYHAKNVLIYPFVAIAGSSGHW